MKQIIYIFIFCFPFTIFSQNEFIQIQNKKGRKIKQIFKGDELRIVLKNDSSLFGNYSDSICKFEGLVSQNKIIFSTFISFEYDTISKKKYEIISEKEKSIFFKTHEIKETFVDSGEIYYEIKKPIRSFKYIDVDSIEYIKYPAKHDLEAEGYFFVSGLFSIYSIIHSLVNKKSGKYLVAPSMFIPVSIGVLRNKIPKKYSSKEYQFKILSKSID